MDKFNLFKTIIYRISISVLFLLGTNDLAGQKRELHTYTKNELFDIEMEFSKMSTTKGFIASNFIYAADSATVFRPIEKNALKWASEQPEESFGIRWYPSFIDMSLAGDLGYAVGPFENHYATGDTSRFILGQFATVWKRQNDGTLKFIMDFGTNRLPVNFKLVKEPVFQKTSDPAILKSFKKTASKKEINEFKKAEQAFSMMCEEKGDFKAFENYADKEIRFFYQRTFYVKGIDSTLAMLTAQKGIHKWKIKQINISSSGDLVHISGTHEYVENNIKKQGYFMRIWKKQSDKKWKIVLQVRSLID